MIVCYTVPEMWHKTYVIVIFHFGLFLPFYPPNNLKSEKLKKKKKKKGKKKLRDIIILLMCTKNYD